MVQAWQPPELFTVRMQVPFPGVPKFVLSDILAAAPDAQGTTVTVRIGRLANAKDRAKLEQAMPTLAQLYEAGIPPLRAAIAEYLDAQAAASADRPPEPDCPGAGPPQPRRARYAGGAIGRFGGLPFVVAMTGRMGPSAAARRHRCATSSSSTTPRRPSPYRTRSWPASRARTTRSLAAIRETGQFEAGEALQPTATATTVRVENGRTITTDGPFAETKEQLGGFYLVDCRDIDEGHRSRRPHPGRHATARSRSGRSGISRADHPPRPLPSPA